MVETAPVIIPKKESEQPLPMSVEVTPPPKENGRAKSTLNLKTFTSTPKPSEEKQESAVVTTAAVDKPIEEEELKKAWFEFAELRKHQIAEYNLLKKDFTLSGVVVTLTLANPFEQPLLQNFRVQLIAHLRGRLNNNSITITSVLTETEAKKVAYTAKEKYDHLAEKNPVLKDLRERFGLDPDF